MNHSVSRISSEKLPGNDVNGATIDIMAESAKAIDVDAKAIFMKHKLPYKVYSAKKNKFSPISVAEFSPAYSDCSNALKHSIFLKDGAESTTFESEEILCASVINCSTLEEAIAMAIKFSKTLKGRLIKLSFEQDRSNCVLNMETYKKHAEVENLVIDFFSVRFLQRFFSWLIAEPLCESKVTLAYDSLIDPILLEDSMGCKVELESSTNSIHFNSRMLRKPIVRSYREMQDVLKISSFSLLPPLPVKNLSTIVGGVILRSLERTADLPTLDQISPILGRSKATVRRHLASENTSFQALLDKCRTEKAIDLLMGSHLTIEEIAFHLGFSASTGFSRAFKAWTGVPPSDYRAQTLGNRGSEP